MFKIENITTNHELKKRAIFLLIIFNELCDMISAALY